MLATRYSNREVQPVYGGGLMAGIRLSSNLALAAGSLIARNTAADANEVQTLTTTGTGTAGSLVITLPNGEQVTVAYNATAAVLQAALRASAFFAGANCTVANSQADISVNTNVATITFTNSLGNLPQTLLVVATNPTGATIAAARTTTGSGKNRFVAYDGTKITDPGAAAAITFSATGAGGSFGAGSYVMQATWVSITGGETLPSIGKMLTLTAAQEVRVAAINAANTPDDAQSLNIYMNGVLIKNIAVSTPGTGGTVAQTDITAPAAGTYQGIPSTSTAFTKANGAWYPTVVLRYDVMTDARGRVTFGTSGSAQHGSPDPEGTGWYSGVFKLGDLTGVDQNAIDQMRARFLRGALGDNASELLIPA